MQKELPNLTDYEMRNNAHPLSLGEAAFAHIWQLMGYQKATENLSERHEDGVALYHQVLSQSGIPVNQHNAYILNTLVAWLGTSAGLNVLSHGMRLKQQFSSTAEAFLYAWASANRRVSWLNRGLRQLEYILLRNPPRTDNDPIILPNISRQDFEVAEALFYWLGGEDGRRLIQTAINWIASVQNTYRHIHTNGPLPIDPTVAFIANHLKEHDGGSECYNYTLVHVTKTVPDTEFMEGDKLRIFQKLKLDDPHSLVYNYRTHHVRLIENTQLAKLYRETECV